MRTALTIARRELSAYFASLTAYLVAAAFLVISGYLFAIILLNSRQATLEGLFFNVNVILLFVAPLLTMRLLADEQHSGTIELLLTAPVRTPTRSASLSSERFKPSSPPTPSSVKP